MLLTLVGAIVLAVAVVGTIALTFRVLKKPVPRGVMPLAAGIAMVGFMAWNENSWFDRTVADLPDTFEVVATGEFSNFIQPWTLIWPRTSRFIAIDTAGIITNETNPDIKAAELVIAERYTPTRVRPQLINCATKEATDISADTELDDAGLPIGATWFSIEDQNEFLDAVCSTPQ